ncbi:tyrosine-type recombinase/integrase [Brevibacterium aurantiacum]|uniref:Integrase n=2 Tax=Brevibacterium aurantiacum TaxID=273384 RepID=A0A1D7W632_BREAU|nr:site-specific integrase [Brevibacterium aurantiacum]AOP54496.1 Integrase [Brevibacterium aurantiacum]RCS94501.1 site-specific integrase [Brevibacterium aurantiacum]
MASIRKYSTTKANKWRVEWRKPGSRDKASMTLDTESEARMWKAMLDETGSDVVDAGRRWNAAQSQEETVDDIVTEYISFQTRGDTRTVKDYKALQRNHITNEIGWQPAASVEAKDLRKYVKTLLAKKLSPKTIRNIFTIVSAAFNLAIQDRRIQVNPCSGVRLPTLIKTEPPVIAQRDIDVIMNAIDPNFSLLVRTLAGTGLRWSEAEALLCSDLFHRSGVAYIRVNKAMKGMGKARHPGPPKTPAAERDVPLDDDLSALLVNHVKTRSKRDYLFTMKKGGRLNYVGFRENYLMPTVERIDVDSRIRCHSFRHYHASVLVAAGVDPIKIAQRLGHTDTTITLNRYSHLRPGADLETLQALNSIWGGNNEPVDPDASAQSEDASAFLDSILNGS